MKDKDLLKIKRGLGLKYSVTGYQPTEIGKLGNPPNVIRGIASIKADAVKDFAETFTEKFIILFNLNYGQQKAARWLCQLIIKETVGEEQWQRLNGSN